MQYFKLVNQNKIIGVVTSDNFMKYSPIADCYIRTDEQNGEYVSYNGLFYRASWMQPITQKSPYQQLEIIDIPYEEYLAFLEAFSTNEEIIEQPIIIHTVEDNEVYQNPIDTASIDFIRSSKITEMSRTCNQVIEAGFDLQLSDGNIHHFSLTTQDQINLISLGSMAANGMEAIPYHADGEICRFYTAEEITTILAQATAFKIYHTTYYNALKNYINSLDTIEAIAAVTYGIELPEEYQSEVLKSLQQ